MQKPDNKSIKDFLQEKVAQDLGIELATVESVISWSYKDANKACETHKEVEISGIGKFMMSQAKLRRRINDLEGMDLHIPDEDPKKKQVRDTLEVLKTKLDGDK